ncbi:MAG TPA: hypothetical protein VMS65_13565 [Polyangiaceae bacterium]|nr:hypothetical protein [Polyangiaceae bacterium]
MGPRLVVSEFPNDNPELHDGLVWACPTPCAPALPTLRLRASAPARVLRPEWESKSVPSASQAPLEPLVAPVPGVALKIEPEVAEVVSAPAAEPDAVYEPEAAYEPEPESLEPAPEAPSPTGFAAFVRALSEILAARGATRAAANIGALLGLERLACDAFDAETKQTLVARAIVDATSGRPTPEFSMLSRAWREVLDGSGGDLSACGSATLDVFGAELLGALLGVPSGRADELRRALRQRGVAAFGILVAA